MLVVVDSVDTDIEVGVDMDVVIITFHTLFTLATISFHLMAMCQEIFMVLQHKETKVVLDTTLEETVVMAVTLLLITGIRKKDAVEDTKDMAIVEITAITPTEAKETFTEILNIITWELSHAQKLKALLLEEALLKEAVLRVFRWNDKCHRRPAKHYACAVSPQKR